MKCQFGSTGMRYDVQGTVHPLRQALVVAAEREFTENVDQPILFEI
jgi:hypothetical protein